MDTSPVEQLARALDDTAAVVRTVREDQWDSPTPCSDWDVRSVVRHVVGGHEIFARALRGEAATAPPAPPEPPLADAYDRSAASMLEAFRTRDLAGEVTIPLGTIPVAAALHLRLVEALVHGWDVAVATGQRQAYDEALAQREIDFARTFRSRIPPGRTPFAAELPAADGAPPIERLAALLGRDVGWTAQPSGIRPTG